MPSPTAISASTGFGSWKRHEIWASRLRRRVLSGFATLPSLRDRLAALSPADAGRSPANVMPGTQSISCRSYRSLIGSLKEA